VMGLIVLANLVALLGLWPVLTRLPARRG